MVPFSQPSTWKQNQSRTSHWHSLWHSPWLDSRCSGWQTLIKSIGSFYSRASAMMPAAPTSRALLRRQTRFILRRNNLRQASTTSEAATKAKETASQTTSKASEGLSKVTSSAGGIVGSAASRAQNMMSKVGGRTGKLVSFVQSQYPCYCCRGGGRRFTQRGL